MRSKPTTWRRSRSSSASGAACGARRWSARCGASATRVALLAAGVAVIVLHVEISDRMALGLEFGVALMLIGLGANALRGAVARRPRPRPRAPARRPLAPACARARRDAPTGDGRSPPPYRGAPAHDRHGARPGGQRRAHAARPLHHSVAAGRLRLHRRLRRRIDRRHARRQRAHEPADALDRQPLRRRRQRPCARSRRCSASPSASPWPIRSASSTGCCSDRAPARAFPLDRPARRRDAAHPGRDAAGAGTPARWRPGESAAACARRARPPRRRALRSAARRAAAQQSSAYCASVRSSASHFVAQPARDDLVPRGAARAAPAAPARRARARCRWRRRGARPRRA